MQMRTNRSENLCTKNNGCGIKVFKILHKCTIYNNLEMILCKLKGGI